MNIKIQCTDCYRTFETLPNLNRHIGQTGHNKKIPITIEQFLKSVGINIRLSTQD